MKIIGMIAALLISQVGWANTAPDLHSGVFFRLGETAWWRKCFAIDQASALRAIKENKIELPEFARNVSAIPAQENIELSFDFFGTRQQHILIPCPFAMADRQVDLQCKVEFKTPRDNIHLDEYYTQIARKWRRRGVRDPLVNCAESTARVITQTLPVTISAAEYHMARFMAAQGLPLETSIAGAVVRAGASLDSRHDWTADFGFSLINGSDLDRIEVCDASVEQISAEGREQWNGKSWCPWAIELVSVQCAGRAAVNSPVAKPWLPVAGSDLRPWCKARR